MNGPELYTIDFRLLFAYTLWHNGLIYTFFNLQKIKCQCSLQIQGHASPDWQLA